MKKKPISIIFLILLFLLFCSLAIEASGFSELAKFFPLYISIIGAVLVLIEIIISVVRLKAKKGEEEGPFHENLKGTFKYILWIVAYLGLTYVIGFRFATAIYLFAFLFFESKMGLLKSGFAMVIVMIALYTFGDFMNLNWPKNLMNF